MDRPTEIELRQHGPTWMHARADTTSEEIVFSIVNEDVQTTFHYRAQTRDVIELMKWLVQSSVRLT